MYKTVKTQTNLHVSIEKKPLISGIYSQTGDYTSIHKMHLLSEYT